METLERVASGVIPGDSGIEGISEQQPLLRTEDNRSPHVFPDGKNKPTLNSTILAEVSI
jgi:hypothetical protein